MTINEQIAESREWRKWKKLFWKSPDGKLYKGLPNYTGCANAAKTLIEALRGDAEATRLFDAAHAHAEDAEGCGYGNYPTGAMHVSDAFKRAEKALERANALKAAALNRVKETP